jgi:hypothetical protein
MEWRDAACKYQEIVQSMKMVTREPRREAASPKPSGRLSGSRFHEGGGHYDLVVPGRNDADAEPDLLSPPECNRAEEGTQVPQ